MKWAVWIGIWIGATVALILIAIQQSRANMENDPSSMAWVGFLPFLVPIFLAQAGVIVIPIAIIYETINHFLFKK